jgi:hypothetical protein
MSVSLFLNSVHAYHNQARQCNERLNENRAMIVLQEHFSPPVHIPVDSGRRMME